MPRTRKTVDEFRLYVNYGQGWEHEVTEETAREIRARCREYRQNAPQYPVRWKKVRVKKETATDGR